MAAQPDATKMICTSYEDAHAPAKSVKDHLASSVSVISERSSTTASSGATFAVLFLLLSFEFVEKDNDKGHGSNDGSHDARIGETPTEFFLIVGSIRIGHLIGSGKFGFSMVYRVIIISKKITDKAANVMVKVTRNRVNLNREES
jgi:hypothetical protein